MDSTDFRIINEYPRYEEFVKSFLFAYTILKSTRGYVLHINL